MSLCAIVSSAGEREKRENPWFVSQMVIPKQLKGEIGKHDQKLKALRSFKMPVLASNVSSLSPPFLTGECAHSNRWRPEKLSLERFSIVTHPPGISVCVCVCVCVCECVRACVCESITLQHLTNHWCG